METDRRRVSGLMYVLAVFGCVSVLTSSSVLGMALREYDLRPPNVYLHMGDIYLVGFTAYPSAWSSSTGCNVGSQQCRPRRRAPIYAVWLVNKNSAATQPRSAFTHLASVPLSFTQLIESWST
jgi:hypothetical protein